MAEAVLEKAICKSCGVDVREGTQFCYNCGNPVVYGIGQTVDDEAADELNADIDSGSNHDKAGEPVKDNKAARLAVAASERKRSRAGQRKPKRVVWEEPGPASNRIFILVCVLIFVIAALIVFLMLFVK